MSAQLFFCFLTHISVSTARQMSRQIPQKVRRQISERNWSTTRFSHARRGPAAPWRGSCSRCVLRRRVLRRGPAPQHPLLFWRLRSFSLKNQRHDLATGEAQEPPEVGRVLGSPTEFSWRGDGYEGNDGILQLRKPLLRKAARSFFMETPFFYGNRAPSPFLIVQRVSAFARGTVEVSSSCGCARQTLAPAGSSTRFPLPPADTSWSPCLSPGVTYSIAPHPGTQPHLQHSRSAPSQLRETRVRLRPKTLRTQ